MSSVRLRRLQADFEKLSAYAQRHPRVRLVQVEGTPPEKYQVEFQIRSLRQHEDRFAFIDRHLVEVFLPRDYPRTPPQCRMLTPVFHPNIAPHAICIGDHWNAGEPLWSLVMRIGEMLAYQSYNTKSPLNGEAARWVDDNEDKLPLDRVPLYIDQEERPASSAGPAVPTAKVVRPGTSTAPPQPPKTASPPVSASPVPTARVVNRPPATPPSAAKIPTARPVQPAPGVSQAQANAAATVTCLCPGCGTSYSVPASMAGKNARCKQCRSIISIPSR